MASAYPMTRDNIITSALRKLGVIAQGDLPDPEQVTEAAQALELLLKHLQASTELRWDLVARTLAIVSGTASYTLVDGSAVAYPDILDVYNFYLMDSGGTVWPIRLVDQNFFDQNFTNLTQETAKPTVAIVQFNRDLTTRLGSVTFTIYPTPVEAYTLHYRAMTKQQNAGVGTDDLNLDELWHRVLIYGLACDLSDEYALSMERIQRLESKYHELLDDARRKSRNTKDTFFIYPL